MIDNIYVQKALAFVKAFYIHFSLLVNYLIQDIKRGPL